MIVSALLGLVVAFIKPVIDLLPVASLDLPGASSFGGALCKVNSLIPVLGPLKLAVTIVSAAVVFIGVRAVLVAWNVVKP